MTKSITLQVFDNKGEVGEVTLSKRLQDKIKKNGTLTMYGALLKPVFTTDGEYGLRALKVIQGEFSK